MVPGDGSGVTVNVADGEASRLPEKWSASAVASIDQCGLKFWFTRVVGWQEPQTIQQVVGIVVHGVLEDFFGLEPPDRQYPVVGELLAARITSETSSDGQFDSEEVRTRSRQALLRFASLEPNPASVDVYEGGLEMRVEASLRGIELIGYIDLVTWNDEVLRVTDYKTGKSTPAYLPDKWRQQFLYAAAMEHMGTPVDEVALTFLGESPRATRRPVYPRALHRATEQLERAVHGASQAFTAHAWQARTGPLCRSCSFRPVCPAKTPSAAEPGSPKSNDVLTEKGLSRREHRQPSPQELLAEKEKIDEAGEEP